MVQMIEDAVKDDPLGDDSASAGSFGYDANNCHVQNKKRVPNTGSFHVMSYKVVKMVVTLFDPEQPQLIIASLIELRLIFESQHYLL